MKNFCVNVNGALKKVVFLFYFKLKDIKNDVRGMSTIEVVLIIAVLVALALLFRVFIMKYANNLFDKIDEQTETVLEDW